MGVRLEIEKPGAEHIGHFLIRAADIDDPHQCAAGIVIKGNEVDQK